MLDCGYFLSLVSSRYNFKAVINKYNICFSEDYMCFSIRVQPALYFKTNLKCSFENCQPNEALPFVCLSSVHWNMILKDYHWFSKTIIEDIYIYIYLFNACMLENIIHILQHAMNVHQCLQHTYTNIIIACNQAWNCCWVPQKNLREITV